MAVDATGDIYVADTVANLIRKISNGAITTVAGNGSASFGGDGGPATNSELDTPHAITLDNGGDLYIADTNNHRVREISNGSDLYGKGGGQPNPGDNGDQGPATSALLGAPQGVAADTAGNLYISDTTANNIRKVSNGIITTAAETENFLSSAAPSVCI